MNWHDDAVQAWDWLADTDNELQWFAKRKDGRTTGGRLRSVEALFGTIRNAEALSWNLYLQANQGRRTGKIKLSWEDITRWRFVIVDLDPDADTIAPPESLLWSAQSMRLFSGRGYQFWIPVEGEPALGADLPPERAERLMRGWLNHLHKHEQQWCPGWTVDTTCSDLARVVRCPGSVNQRTGQRACFEAMLGGKLIAPTDLEQFIAPPPPPLAEPIESANLLEVIPHLNGVSRMFLLIGVESPGRHRACYSTCMNLHELGVPRERTRNWLSYGASICSEPLTEREVFRIVDQVYGMEAR